MLAFDEDRQFLEGREHGGTMVLEYKDVKAPLGYRPIGYSST